MFIKAIPSDLNIEYLEFATTNSIERYLEGCTLRNFKLIEVTLTKNAPLINCLKVALWRRNSLQLMDINAVDYPINQHKKRFEVNYIILDINTRMRIRFRVFVADNESIPSITPIFRSGNWFEREIWDMFGIFFTEHPDLRRILSDYGFEGFPLRKDFPLSGYVQVRFDDEAKRVLVELLSIPQEFRAFDFTSPWERK
jgi:NADH-quinone oxidoreductase subunit C